MLEKSLLKPILTFLLKLFFRVEVSGFEHYRAAGDKVLIVANHQSFLDPLILAVFMPEKPAFAINVFQADKWYFRWLDKLVTLYRLDPTKPMSMKRLIGDLRKGAHVVLFPEGRITTSGGIMKIYEGTSRILEKTGATLLPVRVDGAEYSKVSRMGGKLKQRWCPKVRVTILPPIILPEGQTLSSDEVYDIMTDAAFAAARTRRPLLEAFLDASRLHGASHRVASDIARTDMSYRQLFTRAFILSDKLHPQLLEQRYVGVLLPSSLGALVTFTGLQMLRKVPCMLNFSAGAANVLHACRIATVKTVLTSRAFIEKGKFEHLVEALQREYTVIYLEDIRPTVSLRDKLMALYRAFFARDVLSGAIERMQPDDPAVVLYTSGSEGTPKGVVLSHANILSNIYQAFARLDLRPVDIVFNALPVFHSFGLTIGMLMPVIGGLKTFLYPTPVHYRVIPDLIYDTDATIMLGTDTFFNGYAHYAHPYDFWNVRLAVAGAEKLKPSTRQLYLEKFRLAIMEGYGVTEASPVISVNTPMQTRIGSVGRVFPGIEYRLEKVEGIDHGGRLNVKGPNIMLGYLKADQPGVIQPHGEWYDTGDIVDIDEQGYITILGRAKRFAKIGGEMVSLQAVEDFAHAVDHAMHAAIAVADDKKGEQVVLYTESREITREHLLSQAKMRGIAEIGLPKRVVFVESLPRLGNGKIDYPALQKMMQDGKQAALSA